MITVEAPRPLAAPAEQGRVSYRARALELVALTAGYLILWLANRWPAIAGNPLFWDDFALPNGPAGFYVTSYRPTLFLEYAFWETLVPGHFPTVLPKLTGSLYIALACVALAVFLQRLGVSRPLALSAPLVVLCNPVLADATLWQSSHALGLSLFLIVAGHVAWLGGRAWFAAGLILAGVLGYQIYIGLSLMLLVAEIAIAGTRLHVIARRGAVLAGVALVQLLVMGVTRLLLASDERGFAGIASLTTFAREKWHGITDLVVNGFMPVLAFYFGAFPAMSLWKWVPVLLAAVTAALTRRFVPAIVAPALLVVPSLPVLGISQNPQAWRVSAGVAFALALAVVVAFSRSPRAGGGAVVCLVIAALMAPVSWYEAQMRVESHQRHERLMSSIERHWRLEGVPSFAMAWDPPDGPAEDPRYRGPRDLTWAYEVRTPGMWTPFADSWMTRAFVESNGVAFRHATRWESDRCAQNCTDESLPSPRIMHLDGEPRTLVCPEVLPVPPRRCSPDRADTATGDP